MGEIPLSEREVLKPGTRKKAAGFTPYGRWIDSAFGGSYGVPVNTGREGLPENEQKVVAKEQKNPVDGPSEINEDDFIKGDSAVSQIDRPLLDPNELADPELLAAHREDVRRMAVYKLLMANLPEDIA